MCLTLTCRRQTAAGRHCRNNVTVATGQGRQWHCRRFAADLLHLWDVENGWQSWRCANVEFRCAWLQTDTSLIISNDQRITGTNNRYCCTIETCTGSDPDDGNPRGNGNRAYRFPGVLKQMLWDSCGDEQIVRESRENKTNFPVVLFL